VTRALPFTQASIRRRIAAARSAGLQIIAIDPDGEVQTMKGPAKSSLRLLNCFEAAAYCRCTDSQFRDLIADRLLPKHSSRDRYMWDRMALDVALKSIDVRPRFSTSAEVYFIETERFIKIGFSGSAKVRMWHLQTATPYDLKLLGVINGDEECEQCIHALFAHRRHRGEWFRKSSGLLAYIEWLRARKS